MAYEKGGYVLYARKQEIRGKKFQTIYFFSKRKPIVGEAVDDVPEGYVVSVDKKTNVPFLNKK